MLCNYSVDNIRGAWLNLFWKYINGKIFAVQGSKWPHAVWQVYFSIMLMYLRFRFPKLVNNQMVQELTSQQYFPSTQAIIQV